MKPLFLFVCLLLPGALQAQLVIDQQFLPTSQPPNGYIIEDLQTLAQSFTAGTTGRLYRIEVEIARHTTPPPFPVFAELRTTLPDGSPSNAILGKVQIPTDSILTTFSFVSADFSTLNIPLVSGTRYAIVLRSDSANTGGGINPYAWRLGASGVDGYTAGQNFVNFNNGNGFFALIDDHGFRTIVAIPEPATVILMTIVGIGTLTGITWSRRRRRDLKTSLDESL